MCIIFIEIGYDVVFTKWSNRYLVLLDNAIEFYNRYLCAPLAVNHELNMLLCSGRLLKV